MTRKSNRQIWENAVPLSKAWISFAADADRAALGDTPDFLTKLTSDAAAVTAWANLADAGMAAVKSQQQRTEIQERMRDELLDSLFAGHLVALGFRELPTRSSAPGHIERDFFDDPYISWGNDTADAYGMRYNRVRIYAPGALPPDARPKIGRPSSKEHILKAISELKDANPEFCSLPRKQACKAIWDHIDVRHVSGDGLSDKNLEKYILEICGPRRIKK